MYKNFTNKSVFEKLAFSPIIIGKSVSKKISYIAVVTAVLTVANTVLEIKFLDVQFSLTLFLSAISGIILGPLSGFFACLVGDGIGYILNSWGFIYMPWVGFATAVTAFFAGFITYFFKGNEIVKITMICLSSFLIGTVAINTTGFYLYNYYMGFSTAVLDYVSKTFGTNVNYWVYLIYRLFFKGQIFNCIVNYVLIFIGYPIIMRIPLFQKELEKV